MVMRILLLWLFRSGSRYAIIYLRKVTHYLPGVAFRGLLNLLLLGLDIICLGFLARGSVLTGTHFTYSYLNRGFSPKLHVEDRQLRLHFILFQGLAFH